MIFPAADPDKLMGVPGAEAAAGRRILCHKSAYSSPERPAMMIVPGTLVCGFR